MTYKSGLRYAPGRGSIAERNEGMRHAVDDVLRKHRARVYHDSMYMVLATAAELFGKIARWFRALADRRSMWYSE